MKNKILYETTEFKDLKKMMNYACKKFSKNIAFVIKHKEGKNINYENISYERLGKEINALGTELIDLGYKGKRIAVIGKNRYEWVLAYTSVINGVGVIVPLDKGLPEEEIEMSIKKAKVEVIFCEENYIETIKKIIDKGETSLKEVISMDETEGISNVKDLIKKGEKLVNKGDRRYLDAKINAEEMATIVFTSGTTALSKAVMLSHKNIVSNINSMSKVEWLTETDTNIAFLPYHHTFGSTGQLLYLSKGMKNVYCDGLRHIQENLKEYKVTVFICVPLLIESMYKKIEAAIEKKGKTNAVKFGKILTKVLLKFGIDIRRKVFKEVLDELRGRIKIYSKWCICS